jgi:hypothetical protein
MGGDWVVSVGHPHNGAWSREAVVPYAKVKVVVDTGGREEAESKVPALGDEYVSVGEWLCMCKLVIRFAE